MRCTSYIIHLQQKIDDGDVPRHLTFLQPYIIIVIRHNKLCYIEHFIKIKSKEDKHMSNNKNKNIGVITEQGYAAGMGLGFNPVDEKDLNKKPTDKESADKNKNNPSVKNK